MELLGTEFFFPSGQLPFHTVTCVLDARTGQRFPLNTGFRYALVPFKAGFTVFWRDTPTI
jgi:hypothetical protein